MLDRIAAAKSPVSKPTAYIDLDCFAHSRYCHRLESIGPLRSHLAALLQSSRTSGSADCATDTASISGPARSELRDDALVLAELLPGVPAFPFLVPYSLAL